MADILQFTNALLDSANTVSNVVNDYQTKQANLSTQTKNIQLQNDINGQLARIRQSANFEDWNTQINDFFTQVKSGMSNKDSPYYCQNNLQAEQFTKILEQNQVNVSEQVGRMVQQRQSEKRVLDVQNSKTMLADMAAGQDYIDQANELDRGLYENGDISLEQYQKSKDQNYISAYQNMRIKTFDASLGDALAQGKSFEAFYSDIENNMPELKATDTDGLERAMDKDALNSAIKKACQQNYNAKLADIQQGNADKLSQIVQQMRQNNTAEGKLAVARQGQMAMNRMLGLQLSETDRLKYSALFELSLGDGLGGSGSGSGSGSSKPTDIYETLIKASPDTAVQLWLDGKNGNLYDVTQVVSDNLVKEWFTGNYKENYDKDYAERNEDYETIYRGKTSTDSLTEVIAKQVAEKFPTAKNYIDDNFKNLIKDINDNPKQYGNATVGQLSLFILDWLGESTSDMTDDDFVNAFKKHVNDCYVESCKYMELNKKQELVKTYDATNAKDIAEAANWLHDKDYVFTYNGQDMWAGQSKEALEKKGGLVDVMKNAVAGTLGIQDGNLDVMYKRSRDDMESIPIMKYNGKAYEVVATEDGKGFNLIEYGPKKDKNGKIELDKDGLPVFDFENGKEIKGSIPDKAGERKVEKAEAKAAEKAASEAVATGKRDREQKLQTALAETTTTPKAVETANVIPAEEKDWKWKNSTPEARREILSQANTKIQSDAKKVTTETTGKKKNKNQYTKEDFKKKWNIDYDEWMASNEEHYRYNLILNAK